MVLVGRGSFKALRCRGALFCDLRLGRLGGTAKQLSLPKCHVQNLESGSEVSQQLRLFWAQFAVEGLAGADCRAVRLPCVVSCGPTLTARHLRESLSSPIPKVSPTTKNEFLHMCIYILMLQLQVYQSCRVHISGNSSWLLGTGLPRSAAGLSVWL